MTNPKLAFSELAGRYIDGNLSLDQALTLQELIEEDADLKRELAENVLCHMILRHKYTKNRNLQRHFQEIAAEETRRERLRLENAEYEKNPFAFIDSWEEERRKRIQKLQIEKQPKQSIWPLILSAAILIGLLIPVEVEYVQEQHRRRAESEVVLPNFSGIARIKEVVDPVWGQHKKYRRGEEMSLGELNLEQGLVQLEFKNGAQVVLEGPTRFSIHSPLKTSCLSGKTSVYVPATAVGFEMFTPQFTIIDRGTAFFARCDQNETEVYTIKGLVDLARDKDQVLPLEKGFGIRMNQEGGKERFRSVPDDYISEEKFAKKLSGYCSRQKETQEKEANERNTDEGLLARFDLSKVEKREVANTSKRNQGTGSSLVLEDCGLSEGSISGSRAVLFYDRTSCAKTDLNATCTSVTLMADIRLDRSENYTNVLFVDERFDEEPGHLLWQVSPQGGVILYLSRGKGINAQSFRVPLIGSQIPWGCWTRMAVVLDAEKKKIYHYLDGVLLGQFPWDKPEPLQLGSCIIGNYLAGNTLNNRFLNGAIEQFCIYDRPVTGREMRND